MPELTLISTIQTLFQKYGIGPQKRFGQNFLVSNKALQKIVAAAQISPSDVILEIGPGIGTLTLELARRAKRVVAVEKDKVMVQILYDLLKQKGVSNVEIVQKDARDITERDFRFQTQHQSKARCWTSPAPKRSFWCGVSDFRFSSYKVVANLPYYIAAPMIRKFLEIDRPPEQMVFTIQKEVAQRICARPPHMNILSLSVQFYAYPEIIAPIPNSAFWPKPKVDGAIIKITPQKERPAAEFSKQFFKVIKAGFSQPRKKLSSNLTNNLPGPKEKIRTILHLQNIPDNARAQNVELTKWISITRALILTYAKQQ